MKNIKLGLIGFGTVMGGFWDVLNQRKSFIEDKLGVSIEIRKVLLRRESAIANLPKSLIPLATLNPSEVLEDDDINIIVEAINGSSPANSYISKALANGKSVITANKAAVARNLDLLTESATTGKSKLMLEASVCGGTPVINTLRELYLCDEIIEIRGILNGTTNFILSSIEKDKSYQEALKEAQALGYAEADPSADVDGIDIANKLSILIALGFGEWIHPDQIPTEGIRDIGKVPKGTKLVATASKAKDKINTGIELKTLTVEDPLYYTGLADNTLALSTKSLGNLVFRGPGAGGIETGTSMLIDLLKIIKEANTNE